MRAAPPLCFAKLTGIALLLESFYAFERPAFHVGVPLPPEQGVCSVLGRLVTAGVLPALARVRVWPAS